MAHFSLEKDLSVVSTVELDSVSSSESDPEEQFANPSLALRHEEPVDLKKFRSQTRVRSSKRTLECFSLQGKVCVVTGGASGIGLEICRYILESGGHVAIVDLNSEHLNLYMAHPLLISVVQVDAAEREAKVLSEEFSEEDEEAM